MSSNLGIRKEQINQQDLQGSFLTNDNLNSRFSTYLLKATLASKIAELTDEEKIALDIKYVHPNTHSVNEIVETELKRFVSAAQVASWEAKPTKDYVDQKIAGIIDQAPEALNTLQELSNALNDDPNFATTMATQLGLKANASDVSTSFTNLIDGAQSDLNTLNKIATAIGNDADYATTVSNALATKVDKVTGKGLSTEDYTTAEKTKLEGIEAGANAYVHPATHDPSVIAETSTKQFVSAANVTAWNAKLDGKRGVSAFRGSGQEITIAHGLGVAPTSVVITPNANSSGTLGEYWVRFDATNIYVGNTGASTVAFSWLAIK